MNNELIPICHADGWGFYLLSIPNAAKINIKLYLCINKYRLYI